MVDLTIEILVFHIITAALSIALGWYTLEKIYAWWKRNTKYRIVFDKVKAWHTDYKPNIKKVRK